MPHEWADLLAFCPWKGTGAKDVQRVQREVGVSDAMHTVHILLFRLWLFRGPFQPI